MFELCTVSWWNQNRMWIWTKGPQHSSQHFHSYGDYTTHSKQFQHTEGSQIRQISVLTFSILKSMCDGPQGERGRPETNNDNKNSGRSEKGGARAASSSLWFICILRRERQHNGIPKTSARCGVDRSEVRAPASAWASQITSVSQHFLLTTVTTVLVFGLRVKIIKIFRVCLCVWILAWWWETHVENLK